MSDSDRNRSASEASPTSRSGLSLGRVGIWTFQFDRRPIRECLSAARELEALGYPALWVPEQRGREAMSLASLLLAATDRIVIANGIARASARNPRSMAAAQRTLTEAFPGRYLLGVGGQTRLPGADPVRALSRYLDEMDRAEYVAPAPPTPPPRVIAAINSRMLDLAARSSWGAHTYLCPPEHIAYARKIMGADPLLAAEQIVVRGTDRRSRLAIARRHLRFYLQLPAYRRMLTRLGFGEADLEGGGSDRLIDTLAVSSDGERVAARVRESLEAGADHVCLQVLTEERDALPLSEWRDLAAVAERFNNETP